jgi:tetratricopeptide (TPR) repeat protein
MSAGIFRMWRQSILLAVGASLIGHAQGVPDRTTAGAALFAEGDYAAAEEAFTRELQSSPRQLSLLFNRATARFNQQKYLAARRDLDAYLLLQPQSGPALAFRAQLHLLLGDARAAEADAAAALGLAADEVETLLVRARARAAQKRFADARRDFDQALALRPGHPAALLGRGDLGVACGDLTGALEDFSLTARLAPTEPDAHFKLALLHFRRLELPAARQAIDTAAKLTRPNAAVERMTA